MPVWIPWLKVSQQAAAAKGSSGGGGGGKGWQGGGGGGGKSWGGGGRIWQGAGGGNRSWGPRPARKPPAAVPESFQVNEQARYAGTVKIYKKFSGYGFINMSQKGVVPDDIMYVNWRSLKTEDRFPQLVQDMAVELSVMKVKDRPSGVWTLKSKNVSMPGGALIAVQDELDAQTKEFVGGQHLRYTGQLQFFSPKRSFGWLVMDDGYALPEPVNKELKVDLPEVNAGGRQPVFMREIAVEFGIVKDKRGGHKAYNMTLPGGIPMTIEGLEHRVVLGSRTFQGTVEMFSWKGRWGFIKGKPGTVFPPNVIAKIKQQQEDSARRGKAINHTDQLLYFRKLDVAESLEEVEKGQEVTFKVYTDDKGAGACEIH